VTLIPEVHDALARAVNARSRTSRRWHVRRAALLLVGTLIATGVALAATGAWHPMLGDNHRGHPTVARTPVPGDQSAAIAVLRRPQTDADRGPQIQAVLRLLPRQEIGGVHTDGIRLLRRRPDGVTILVPAERVGRHDKGYRSSIQRRVLCVMASSHQMPQTTRVPSGRTVRTPGGLFAGQACGGLMQLRTTGIGLAINGPKGFLTIGLVPDGVASVIVRLRHHRLITAPVRNNLYEVSTGAELAPGWGVTWLDAAGHRIEHRRRRH
jgi:hypothetical protein